MQIKLLLLLKTTEFGERGITQSSNSTRVLSVFICTFCVYPELSQLGIHIEFEIFFF